MVGRLKGVETILFILGVVDREYIDIEEIFFYLAPFCNREFRPVNKITLSPITIT
jgi:hypothetical protein